MVFNTFQSTQLITSPFQAFHQHITAPASCPLSSATGTNTLLLNFSLYISQRLGDGKVLFTEFQASAVDVIANLFDRQLGNELMMAFRPALRLNRHSSSSLPDMLTFNALDSSSSASWPQRGRKRGRKGKKVDWLQNKKPGGFGWLFQCMTCLPIYSRKALVSTHIVLF